MHHSVKEVTTTLLSVLVKVLNCCNTNIVCKQRIIIGNQKLIREREL